MLRLQQAFNLVEAESLLGQLRFMDRASSFGPRVCKDLTARLAGGPGQDMRLPGLGNFVTQSRQTTLSKGESPEVHFTRPAGQKPRPKP